MEVKVLISNSLLLKEHSWKSKRVPLCQKWNVPNQINRIEYHYLWHLPSIRFPSPTWRT